MINNKLKIKLITDNFFISVKFTTNYSIIQKTPLKWGIYWMVMGILGLSGEV